MTSLDYIFTMERALVNIILSPTFFFSRIFKFFVALLRAFGMQKDVKIRSHFAGGVSEQGDMQKMQFPKNGVRRVVHSAKEWFEKKQTITQT